MVRDGKIKGAQERKAARSIDAGAGLSRLAHWNDGPSNPPLGPFLI